jgi:putative N6-adenine-specific DNA methylase
MKLNFISPCLLGIESAIASELKDMGATDINAENGRVLFSGDERLIARANICSRFSERILISLGSFTATSFEELFEGTKKLPWESFIGKNDAFPVKGYCLNSKLFAVSSCQSIIKKAVVERLKEKYKVPWFAETGPLYQIQFSIMKDVVTLSIDTSGSGLHKRGYRPVSTLAPIKETLAAALCHFAKLKHYHTLYDPMCGSGTVIVEGALLANNIAPGLNRQFTAMTWNNLNRKLWQEEKERAQDLVKKDTDFFAYGSDIDPEAINIARQSLKRAGLEHFTSLKVADLKDFSPTTERGTLITNPPYGERLLDVAEAKEIYKVMGRVFEPKHGWSYNIITSDEDFPEYFGRKPDKNRKLYNGMIQCRYYMYFKD